MKSTSFGMAILVLVSGGAMAQSNVSVYGVLDAGLVRESGGTAGNVTNLSSGIASGSRLGFKGKEDLGGGLSAVFLLENGFNTDTGAAGQGGLLFGRQAYVGLSGQFGTVTLGRQYSPYYKTLRDIGDAFGAVSMAGRAGNIMATNTRVDNMVEYLSPAFKGWRAGLAYGAGEMAGDSAKNRQLSGSLGYASGALTAQVAYHRIENATATDATRNTLLSANYKFAIATAYASYARNKGPGLANSDDLVLGVAVTAGPGKVLLSHVRHDDKAAANRDASQWGVGYQYPLSKRTDLYAAYARISNRNGAVYRVGNATDRGTGDSALNLGVRHNF